MRYFNDGSNFNDAAVNGRLRKKKELSRLTRRSRGMRPVKVEVTFQEYAVLKKLAEDGPSRKISPPTIGRLALYKLIDGTPVGWAITAAGKEALRRPVSATPDIPRRPKHERSGRVGARKPRVSPFR